MHYALKYLERSEHLTFCEDIEISTQVKILVDRSELYEIDLPDPAMVTLLESLMRRYTGVFSSLVPIREDQMATACGLSAPVFRQLLYRTALEHVIKYVPGERCDVIYLHHNRLMPGNVDLQKAKYDFLLQNARARAEAVAEYASETDECRSRWLLRYFGQEESSDCGSCDVCRLRRSSPLSAGRTGESPVRAWWAAHPGASLQEFRAWCADPGSGAPPDAVSLYRRLLDEGEV